MTSAARKNVWTVRRDIFARRIPQILLGSIVLWVTIVWLELNILNNILVPLVLLTMLRTDDQRTTASYPLLVTFLKEAVI